MCVYRFIFFIIFFFIFLVILKLCLLICIFITLFLWLYSLSLHCLTFKNFMMSTFCHFRTVWKIIVYCFVSHFKAVFTAFHIYHIILMTFYSLHCLTFKNFMMSTFCQTFVRFQRLSYAQGSLYDRHLLLTWLSTHLVY